MSKLKNFPAVYYVSLEESVDRRQYIEGEFSKYEVTNFTPMIFKRFAECNDVLHGPLVHTLASSNKGASTSHLRSMKKWLSETNDEYAIFCEDDLSFKTVEYWNFTWQDFMNNLPSDWECVQLMWVRPHMLQVEFRERFPDDWSATSFMVKRHYAQRLVDRFYPGEEFFYDMGNLQPIVENIMYSAGKVYTVPLFVEEVEQLQTTFINSPEYQEYFVENGQGHSHNSSCRDILNWWKTHGSTTPIKKLMGTSMFTKSFDWGKFSPELVESIKKEIDREGIYELVSRVKAGDVVVDIGASVGPFTYSILHKNPSAVYCMEPSKDLFVSLVKNTNKATADFPIFYINKAISNGNLETVKVFSPGNPNVYGGVSEFDHISFKKFIEEYELTHIDFLKIDCEGGEYDIFTDENIEFLTKNVKNVAAEFHITYPGCKEKFKNFRNKYLTRFKHYLVMSTSTQNVIPGFKVDLSRWIFDDSFLDMFYGELMIYMHNGR